MDLKKVGSYVLTVMIGFGAYSSFDHREKILERFFPKPAIVLPAVEQTEFLLSPKEKSLEDFLSSKFDTSGNFVSVDPYIISEDGGKVNIPNPLNMSLTDDRYVEFSGVVQKPMISIDSKTDNLLLAFYDHKSRPHTLNSEPGLVQVISKFEGFNMFSDLAPSEISGIEEFSQGFVVFRKENLFSGLFCPSAGEHIRKEGRGNEYHYQYKINPLIIKDYVALLKDYSSTFDEVFLVGSHFNKYSPDEFVAELNKFEKKYLN